MISHKVKHYYQPTNHTCSQSAMASLLSYFGEEYSPMDIANLIPVTTDEKGADWGTITQQLATWCISLGYKVIMYTADFEVIDLSWASMTKDEVLARMEKAKKARNVPSLGKEWSETYMQSYIDFINTGGELHILPYMTTELLDQLLEKGPVMSCVCYSVINGTGRRRDVSLRKSVADDINGNISNHSIVIYGKDDKGRYSIIDPWKEPGRHELEPEQLLCGMTAAQIECDNLIFQLHKK